MRLVPRDSGRTSHDYCRQPLHDLSSATLAFGDGRPIDARVGFSKIDDLGVEAAKRSFVQHPRAHNPIRLAVHLCEYYSASALRSHAPKYPV